MVWQNIGEGGTNGLGYLSGEARWGRGNLDRHEWIDLLGGTAHFSNTSTHHLRLALGGESDRQHGGGIRERKLDMEKGFSVQQPASEGFTLEWDPTGDDLQPTYCGGHGPKDIGPTRSDSARETQAGKRK